MKTNITILISIIIFGLYTNYEPEVKVILVNFSKENINHIRSLHPSIRYDVAILLIKLSVKSQKIKLLQSYRYAKEQNRFYQSGRADIGEIVTNTDGFTCESYHQFGMAFDVQCLNCNIKQVAEIAKQQGFEWGGDWVNFYDPAHFQRSYGFTTRQLMNKILSGEKTGIYPKIK